MKILNKLKFLAFSAVLLLLPFAVHADGMPQENGKGKTSAAEGAKKAHSANPAAKAAGKAARGNTQPLSDFELGRYQYCGQDSDCAVAINGCCDCVNGGVEVAVNKARLDDFRARFACLHVACGDKIADPPCANGVVSCVNHKCNYYDDRPQEQF